MDNLCEMGRTRMGEIVQISEIGHLGEKHHLDEMGHLGEMDRPCVYCNHQRDLDMIHQLH